MAEESTKTPPAETEAPADDGKPREETVPYERFEQVNRKAREATEARKGLEAELAKLRAEAEDRATAGLPELEQTRKRLEAAERRAEENERKAAEAEAKVTRASRERWVTAAAQAADFADPSDASAFLNLDDIEDEKDAERAVKRLAAAKRHLVKPEEPRIPGRVLENGRRVEAPRPVAGSTAEADRQWAEEVAPQLKKLVDGWSNTSS